jgi:thiol-disulfide isomerase/thioredoxin
MKRLIILSALTLLMFQACKNREGFKVSGVVENRGEKEYINISRLDISLPVLIDSAKINRKGEFTFRIPATEPDFYQIGYSSSDFITLLAEPGEKIHLRFDGKYLADKYNVAGSPGSEKLRVLDNDLTLTMAKLDSLSNLYNIASKEEDFAKRGPELEEQFTSLLKEQRRKNIAFIIGNLNSLASIKAIYQRINDETYVLYDPKDLQYMKIATDTLTKYYPASKHVQALERDFTNQLNQMYTSRLHEMVKDIPETKLDPSLVDVNGKRISLSSQKGKYVLLTFWSVRSNDCITENMQLKEYYKLYKKKGFEIYQINLDENENDWKSAVKFDELPWISTREDDPSDPVNARLFNVKALPTNYLFDKEGNIIATNLHGKALQIKLQQLFK